MPYKKKKNMVSKVVFTMPGECPRERHFLDLMVTARVPVAPALFVSRNLEVLGVQAFKSLGNFKHNKNFSTQIGMYVI